MKILLLIILAFSLPFKKVIGQTKTEILKFNISRIDYNSKFGDDSTLLSEYYDIEGKVIKYESSYKRASQNFVIINKYVDTLLVKVINCKYENGNLIDSTVTNFDYQFDNQNRIISNIKTNSLNEIQQCKFSYNGKNEIDTTFVYNNDLTISAEGQPFGNEKKLTKTVTLKGIEVTEFHKDTVIFKKCCPYNNTDCSIIESLNSDTLDILIEKAEVRRSCPLYYVQVANVSRTYKKDGQIYFYENTAWDQKIYYKYVKNDLGLITRRIVNKTEKGNQTETVTDIKYFFRN